MQKHNAANHGFDSSAHSAQAVEFIAKFKAFGESAPAFKHIAPIVAEWIPVLGKGPDARVYPDPASDKAPPFVEIPQGLLHAMGLPLDPKNPLAMALIEQAAVWALARSRKLSAYPDSGPLLNATPAHSPPDSPSRVDIPAEDQIFAKLSALRSSRERPAASPATIATPGETVSAEQLRARLAAEGLHDVEAKLFSSRDTPAPTGARAPKA
jgi:hypothetical protein